MARNCACDSATHLIMKLIALKNSQHIDVTGPRVMAYEQVRVARQDFYNSRA